MGDRVILHSDINCCYASIEHLHHPELAGKPLAVGGDPEARHGIVLTADYIAKKYGVKTGMALWQAKQVCPDITFVSPRMDLYLRFSRMAHEIYAEYTDRQEPYGIDECWLDVTGSSSLKGDGLLIAQEISRRMKSELGITVSVGVSFNKIFAKLGSDYKKPDAITTMYKSEFKQKAWSLPVADLLYVGKRTNRKLALFGIKTIGDLARADEDVLNSHLGKMGSILWSFANGYDDSSVKLENTHAPIKSVGNSTTAPKDLVCDEDVKIVLYILAESVAARLRENGFRCRVVEISVRDNELFSFTRQKKIDHATNITGEIATYAYQIFKENYNWSKPIRSVGVRGADLVTDNYWERVIAVNDNYDSDNYDGFTGGMNVAFKNLIYMLYSRDLSNKICSAKHTRILNGENISGQLRYGYVKDPNDKHKIIVDPEAAEVVKLIFELTAQGKRKTEVANYLNAHGIDTPSAYKKRKGSKNFFHAVEVKSLWSTSSIHDILNDEVYLGKLIWNKTKKRVGSNNTSTYLPKDEWIVIENCHEPIITQKLFDMAHANSKKYIRPKRGKRNYNPFYYCGVCGRALAPSKRVKGDILLCSSSRIEKNSPFKSNRVEISKVEDAIMKIVNMYATAYLDEKGIKKAGKSKEVSPEEKIATLEKKVKSLSSKKMMLYSDYKDDKLTREEYVKRSKAMVEQIDELHQEIEKLKTEIPPEDNSSSKFETQLESIINMESFDREKIQKVIKKVIINGAFL